MSINWGAREVGMYASLDKKLKQWVGLDDEQAVLLLEMSMGGGSGTSFGLFEMDWSKGEETRLLRKLVKRNEETKGRAQSKDKVCRAVERLTKEDRNGRKRRHR